MQQQHYKKYIIFFNIQLTFVRISLFLLSSFKCQNSVRRNDDFFTQLSFQAHLPAFGQCSAGSIRIFDLTSLSPLSECIVAAAVHRLTTSEADADVALEPDVVTRGELEGVKAGKQTIGLSVVFPFAEDTRVSRTTIVIRHNVFVLDIVFHSLGYTASSKATVNCYAEKGTILFEIF